MPVSYTHLALAAAGTVLFFISAAGIAADIMKKRKGFYYRKLHIFDVNQLGSRIKTAGISIAVVSILMYLSVSVMGIGMGLGPVSYTHLDGETENII